MSETTNNSAFSVDGKSAIVTGAGSGRSILVTSEDNIAERHHRDQLLLRQIAAGEEFQRCDR